jgi:NDP-sugar pyrophosphorylase family protein
MKAIVLAGGKGTRLLPYTTVLPKPLMPIGDMPILEIMLRQMKHAGVQEVILTVGHLAELLRAFFKDGQQFGLKIDYSLEDKPLGTADPLSLISHLVETFIVTNGDVLTTLNLADLVAYHQRSGAVATIAMQARQVKVDLGVLEFTQDYQLTGYREKPSFDFHVSMGVYVFEPKVLKFIPKNEYLDFPDLVLKLIDAGEKVIGYPFDGYWQDLGRADDYEQAIQEFEQMREKILPMESSNRSP